jgi:hypothetical protein
MVSETCKAFRRTGITAIFARLSFMVSRSIQISQKAGNSLAFTGTYDGFRALPPLILPPLMM